MEERISCSEQGQLPGQLQPGTSIPQKPCSYRILPGQLGHSGDGLGFWCEEVELAKGEFARLIGASPDEIAVSTSVSEIISSIAEICHSKGVPLLVDAYQSLGTVAIDVKKQKIDMLCCGNL